MWRDVSHGTGDRPAPGGGDHFGGRDHPVRSSADQGGSVCLRPVRGGGSREKRQALLRKLGLPAHLSPNAMLPVLSALYDRQTLLEEMRKL